MSLKNEFDNILKQYGHDVLLISQTNIRCTCYDALTGSTNRKCPYCFGTSYIPKITKEITREEDSNISSSLSMISDFQTFGEMIVTGRYYFFKNDVEVKANDLILDVDWKGNRPIHVGRPVLKVSHVDRKRFINGEVVFQKVYTKTQPILRDIRAIHIIEKYNQTYYYLSEGDN